MLILTRNKGQTIKIGEDIVITVVGVKGGQVSIGITAPKDIPVHRSEIYDLIKAQQAQSTQENAHVR